MKRKAGGEDRPRVLVLGVGNILLRDEGLGVRTIEYIQKNFTVPNGVDVLDGGTGGLALISVIRGYGRLIIVDAVANKSAPGALYRIDGRTMKNSPPLMATAHQLGVRDMLALAGLEGFNPEVVVIGVEPLDISAGLALSGLIEKKIPEAAAMVAKELRAAGFEMKEKRQSA